MNETNARPYQVRKITVVLKGSDILVREYELGPGEVIPWHHHTQVSDYYYCLEGTTLVETREPQARHDLAPGDSATVTSPTVHRVSNPTAAACRFLLIQGVGRYDFVKDA
jgi:quercetin dioxygenase-like cupin family protein